MFIWNILKRRFFKVAILYIYIQIKFMVLMYREIFRGILAIAPRNTDTTLGGKKNNFAIVFLLATRKPVLRSVFARPIEVSKVLL